MDFDDGCGSYVDEATAVDLKIHYDLPKLPKHIHPSYGTRPGQTLPVVIALEDGKPQLEMMRWGLIPFWAKSPKVGYSTFNARDDSVFKLPTWRSIYKKRALIPATGYFEWTKPGKESKEPKQKFYFRPKKLDIFSFAGFYDVWKDVEDKEWKTYTLITTEPNKEAKAIHDRMPVILSRKDEASWLEPSRVERKDIEPFLHPLEDNGLEVVEVSMDVNKLEYDDPKRIASLS